MSSSDKNIVDNFRDVCLADLRAKQADLIKMQQDWGNSIRAQCQAKTQQISKILVELEDYMVLCLRSKFKQILEIQQAKMKQEVPYLQAALNDRICWRMDYLDKIIATLQGDGAGRSKMMGKIAAGKIQQQSKQFKEQVENLRISQFILSFGKQEIDDLIQQLIDIQPIQLIEAPQISEASVSNKKQSRSLQNKSQLTRKNMSKNISQQIPFHNNSKISINLKNQSRHTLLRNQSAVSAVSVQLQEQQEYKLNDQAIQQYKQTKTIRKVKKMQQKIKEREVSPEKDVEYLIKLALERKKLLQQLE